jgi:hypothetical protein
MGAYQGVPPLFVHTLNPSHIVLNQSRAAPLARLEQNEPNGQRSEPLPLKSLKHAALRSVEGKGHKSAGELVVNAHAPPRPVLEVVPAAQSL